MFTHSLIPFHLFLSPPSIPSSKSEQCRIFNYEQKKTGGSGFSYSKEFSFSFPSKNDENSFSPHSPQFHINIHIQKLSDTHIFHENFPSTSLIIDNES